MRPLILATGLFIVFAGIAAFRATRDDSLLQGGLTLGGGFLICAAFSLKAKWHGFVGAGVLALIGALRSAPALVSERGAAFPFMATAFALCFVLLIATVRCLLAERTRRSIERLKSE